MILEIMQNIRGFLLDFLGKLSRISESERLYERKCQQLLEHQMAVYAKVITINDLKQFYLAKLQGYLQEELDSGLGPGLQELPPHLQEIHEAYEEMRLSLRFFRVLKQAIFN